MKQLKKAWITPMPSPGFVSLTLESAQAYPEHYRIGVSEMVFPDRANVNTCRHTLAIGLLTAEDLVAIRDVIDQFLQEERA